MITLIRLVFRPITALLLSIACVSLTHANTVIHYDDAPVHIGMGLSSNVDLDKDGQTDFIMDITNFSALTISGPHGLEVAISGGYLAPYASDVLVDDNLSYATSAAINENQWMFKSGIIAYRFQYQGSLAYGWAEVEMLAGTSGSITQWAFDTSGASILTGATVSAVPEPSTYAALFGLCALGFVAYRKRRRA